MMTPKRFAWLTIIILIGFRSSIAQEEIKFSVSTGSVPVPVLVTRDGLPVNDLKASDFEVFDNGVRQEIESASLQLHEPIDVILVFDMSGSVGGELLDHLKNAVQGLLAGFTQKDRAAFIMFNQAVVLGSALTEDLESIKSALDRAQPSGNSSLIDASYAGLILAKKGRELPLIIIFSDGLDTSSWLSSEMVLETAKRSDSVVYAISTQRRTKESFLNDLTDLTGGNFFEVGSSGDLPSKFLDAIKEFRYRYRLSFAAQAESEECWHKLEVRVKSKSATIRTRPGYDSCASDR